MKKGGLDGTRAAHMASRQLAGKAIRAVCMGYHCFLTKRIKEMRAGLGMNGSGKTKALVSLEKKQEKWLEQRSLSQILDWFFPRINKIDAGMVYKI